jgi:hypothetical protein
VGVRALRQQIVGASSFEVLSFEVLSFEGGDFVEERGVEG